VTGPSHFAKIRDLPEAGEEELALLDYNLTLIQLDVMQVLCWVTREKEEFEELDQGSFLGGA
jgi:hypothetical protein